MAAHHPGDRRTWRAGNGRAALRKRSVTRSRYRSVRGAENAAMAGTRFTFCDRCANAGCLRHVASKANATLAAQAAQGVAIPEKGKRREPQNKIVMLPHTLACPGR